MTKRPSDENKKLAKKLGFKLLGRPATPEQQAEMRRERKRMADERRALLYPWTDDEVSQYIEAFRTQRPDQYAEYIRQEIERNEIEAELGLEMERFAKAVFPHVASRDCTELFGKVRSHVRASLDLNRK